jgi:hypothetical protein
MTQQYPPYPPQGDPQWSQGPLPPPVRPVRPKRKRWPLFAGLALVVFALFAGCVAVVTSSNPQASSTTGATRTNSYSAPIVPQDDPEPAQAPEQSTQSGPLTTFSDGTYEVGTGDGQVAPGKYKSPGGPLCYWSRLKNNDGALGDILDNNAGGGQSILNVKKTDGYIQITGCTFTKA